MKNSGKKTENCYSALFTLLTLLILNSYFIHAENAPSKSPDLPGVPNKSVPAETPKQQSSMPEGLLPEVVIKGGEKSGVASEKPLLEVNVNADDPVLPVVEVEKEILQRQPESLRNPSAGFSNSLFNKNTLLPSRIRLARDPVKVFYPLRDILAISPSQFQEIGSGWEMTITDTEGHSFRKFSGKGLPPANIRWNGRSERGEIVEVGKSYSAVIGYKDTRGQNRNYVGEPFSFDGVIHQESKGLIISLDLSAVFISKKGSSENEIIEESSLELLRETADYIKRYYFTLPISIECYSKDLKMSAVRAQAVSKILQSFLLLPRGEIPTAGFPSDLSSERIDIVITNR